MPTEVIMPALGMSQDTGRLIAWLKDEGESVEKGEPLIEIETDKVTVEVEAQASGTLADVRASEGDDVPVGEVIAIILAEGESVPDKKASSKPEPVSVGAKMPTVQTSDGVPSSNGKTPTPVAARVAEAHDVDLRKVPASGDRITRADVEAYLNSANDNAPSTTGRILASPKARRLAQENGLDLAVIAGSGPEGAVLANDVLTYEAPIVETEAAQSQPSTAPVAPAAQGEVQTGRMWLRTAERLTESWQTIPHFYLERDVDASALIAWRQQLKQRADIKVTFTDLLVKVVAAALRQHPYVNGCWNGEGVVFNQHVHVGLAVAVDEGLIVPVVHHADTLGVLAIAQRRDEIVNRALSNKLQPADLQGGTFTISNLGMYGIDGFSAIVNPPQAAILAVGNITEQIVPRDGEMVIQPTLSLTLSCDHRAVDGARGAQFLRTLANLISDPMQLMD